MPQLPTNKRRRPTSRKATARDTTGRTGPIMAPEEPRRPRLHATPLRRLTFSWWNRLYSAIFGGTWSDQPQMYDAGQGSRDYALNTLGSIAWGTLFPVLTVVSTQIVGAEEAGQFNLAFTTATLLLCLANYGVRTYQVSDIDENESFASYQIQRVMTCVLMFVTGLAYCVLHRYDQRMTLICVGAFSFRALDALSDVYEGRLQQQDKLYLAGTSLAARSFIPVMVFSLLLLVSHDLVVASLALGATELVTLLAYTLPLTLLETPRSRKWLPIEIWEIFRDCFPTFLALFLFALIEAVPKYAMEGVLSYDNQIFFSALFFPAQAMLMIVGFVYKPQLVRLANIWADTTKRAKFDLIVVAMLVVCVLVTLCGLTFARFAAIPLNSLLYATDFEPYRQAQYLMVVAGGLTAAIDFLYQIITVLRRQAAATRVYLGATAFVIIASMVLVRIMGFDGAVWAYFSVMAVLLLSLLVIYMLIRTSKDQN